MSELFELSKKIFGDLKMSEEGKRLLKERGNYVFQFEFDDDAPFHFEIKGGDIFFKEGLSSLDWKRKDWQKISRIWSDRKIFKEVMKGQKEVAEAQFLGGWSFSSWIATFEIQKWFCNLLRIGQEHSRTKAFESYLG